MVSDQDFIHIVGAKENNLKNISLDIPKKKITVFTGVSGSGKSSLVVDTITACSRRELNETFPSFIQHYLPKYGRPHVERIENLPVSIVIDQKKPVQNSRSTVGTYTDIYSLLRLLFSRVGKPFAGYSEIFSFNHPNGRCTRCDGLGEIRELDIHKLVDFDKCLNDSDVIHYLTFQPHEWRWIRYAHSGLFDLNKKIKDYSPEELELFLYSPVIKLKNPPSNWPKTAKYEGLIPRMYRSIINSEEGKLHKKAVDPLITTKVCPDCLGARLNPLVLSCKINGKSIDDVTKMDIPEMLEWLKTIDDPKAVDMKEALCRRLMAMQEIGLGYLTLGREMDSLSGGEAQRCKIAKYINSSLSDVLYVLDEPSVGLHNHDIRLLINSVRKLRDNGNTVLLVEHHKDMISIADHIVDMGPGSGAEGGKIIYEGSYAGLMKSSTQTGLLLSQKRNLKLRPRTPKDWFIIKNANLHNLKNLTVKVPLGVMTSIVGVAGSGKTSLMQCFRNQYPGEIVYISQRNIGISLRSTPGTYTEAANDIRKLFAKETGAEFSMFTFNGKGGCPVCGGKGIIVSNMAFMDPIETVCEACGGLRYNDEALSYEVNGLNIAQVMDLSVNKAIDYFKDTSIAKKLLPLQKVGVGYLHLNQALSTLSGGELQRVKLASFLDTKKSIYILDEPTDGLHVKDINHIIELFDSMVDNGNSIFLIEHSLEVLKASDYVIEIGPAGGRMGGELLYSGEVKGLLNCQQSMTRPYLQAELT